jgi:hypothetical protein
MPPICPPVTNTKEKKKMCQFKSACITKDNQDQIHVWTSKKTDSHEQIQEEFKLPDDHARVELTPPDNNYHADIKDWILSLDNASSWWNDGIMVVIRKPIEECAIYQLKKTDCEVIEEFAIALDNSTVTARGNSTVEAWGNSMVTARDNSTVTALDNSTVTARDNSTVEARDNSTVTARGRSVIRNYTGKIIELSNDAVEIIYNSGKPVVHTGNGK